MDARELLADTFLSSYLARYPMASSNLFLASRSRHFDRQVAQESGAQSSLRCKEGNRQGTSISLSLIHACTSYNSITLAKLDCESVSIIHIDSDRSHRNESQCRGSIAKIIIAPVESLA